MYNENNGAIVQNCSYDALKRLVKSTESGKDKNSIFNEYSYDAAGNRLTWVSNDDAATPKPFDKINLDYEYNNINELTKIKDKDEKPGNSTKKINTIEHKNDPKVETKDIQKVVPQHSQSFIDGTQGFLKHLESEHNTGNINDKAYNDLLNQINALVLDSDAGTLIQSDATTKANNIVSSINSFEQSKDIKNHGVAVSLLNQFDDVKSKINTLPTQLQYTTETQTTTVEVPPTIEQVEELVPAEPGRNITFSYDNNGNRVSMEQHGPKGPPYQKTQYTYDPEDRLASVTNYQAGNGNNWISKDETKMSYDGLGRRLTKSYDPSSKGGQEAGNGGSKKTQYVYNNLDPIAEYDTKTPQYTNYYRGDRNNIISKQDFPSGSNGQQTWFHYDALDSVVGLTKQNGQSDKNYRYDDFGKIIPENGNFTDPHNHYTYTGQEWDENTNLYEFYSRAYDPVTSVWLQQDRYRGQIQDPMSLLRYSYVKNSPVNFKDLYGYDWWSDWSGDLSRRANDWSNDLSMRVDIAKQDLTTYGQHLQNDPVKTLSSTWLGFQMGALDWAADTVTSIGQFGGSIVDWVGERFGQQWQVNCFFKNAASWEDQFKEQAVDWLAKNGGFDAFSLRGGMVAGVFAGNLLDVYFIAEGGIKLLTKAPEIIKSVASFSKNIPKLIESSKGILENLKGVFTSGDELAKGLKVGEVTKGTGKLIGQLDNLSSSEKAVVNELINQGKSVEIIPRGSLKTPDFIVDGVKVELKTLQSTNINTAITRIQDGFRQGAQKVILDLRNTEFNSKQIGEIIDRAKGTYSSGNLPGSVEIITNEGKSVTF